MFANLYYKNRKLAILFILYINIQADGSLYGKRLFTKTKILSNDAILSVWRENQNRTAVTTDAIVVKIVEVLVVELQHLLVAELYHLRHLFSSRKRVPGITKRANPKKNRYGNHYLLYSEAYSKMQVVKKAYF